MAATEDIFDMTPSIHLLEQGVMSLQKALDFLKEGSTEGLLQYFQISAPDGTKHFPSMVTKYEHGIGNTLAKRLEEELLKDTGFFFRYEPGQPQSFHLYYHGNIHDRLMIATLDPYTRKVYLRFSYQERHKFLTELREKRRLEIERKEEALSQAIAWLKRHEKLPWVKIQDWAREYMEKMEIHLTKGKKIARNRESWLARQYREWKHKGIKTFWEKVRKARDQISLLKEDAERLNMKLKEIEEIDGKMEILRRFEKYDFQIVPMYPET